ncbi:MAG TPA: hypothetical protein DIU14_04210, partial [Actinobacteria bacterium]|nr:hypothetical protein [Actinomycetota bacterium]
MLGNRTDGLRPHELATEDLARDTEPAVVGARFHGGVSGAIVDAAATARACTGVTKVALSGGVFQNLLLLGQTVAALEERGFDVLVHSRVPLTTEASASARPRWPPHATAPRSRKLTARGRPRNC